MKSSNIARLPAACQIISLVCPLLRCRENSVHQPHKAQCADCLLHLLPESLVKQNKHTTSDYHNMPTRGVQGQQQRQNHQGCNLLMEVVMVNVCEGEAIKQHRASVRVIEALYEVDDGGLAPP